jgi:hypothetical protein
MYVVTTGLTKKDICKMLTHSEISLQRVGLQLVLALAQRLQRALRESGVGGNTASSNRGKGLEAGASLSRRVNAALEHSVVAAIQSYLPEFQLLVNMRARYDKMNPACDALLVPCSYHAHVGYLCDAGLSRHWQSPAPTARTPPRLRY